jgi:hypothetical protein
MAKNKDFEKRKKEIFKNKLMGELEFCDLKIDEYFLKNEFEMVKAWDKIRARVLKKIRLIKGA